MVNFYCLVGILIVKYELIQPKLFLGNEIRQTFAKKASSKETAAKFYLVQEFLTNSSTRFGRFLQPGSEILAEKGDPNPGTSRMAQYGIPPGYSYGELTIENIKEAYIRHFTRQLSKNVACNVLAI